jgi:hypothetical protein
MSFLVLLAIVIAHNEISSYLIVCKEKNYFSFFYFIIFTFTYICIYCWGHLPPAPPPPLLDRTCSSLFSDFVEEKT